MRLLPLWNIATIIYLAFSRFGSDAATVDVNEPIANFGNQEGIRVSRISGGPYNQQRISTVWKRQANDSRVGFSFRHRWKQFSFRTNVVPVPSDFPAQGAPVRGIMLGDVCVSSRFVPCLYSGSYGTLTKITWALNSLANDGLNFWAMLGDNLYDEDGSVTELFFSRLSNTLQNVPLVAVPGNHDFWTRGGPSNTSNNQFGYGYTQYYMIDTEATRGKGPAEFPFDFPKEDLAVFDIPSDMNFFHYSAIGGAGFIAFSGAHAMDMTKFDRACKYFSSGQPGAKVGFVFLLSHWSSKNLGCQEDMYSARVHTLMSDPSSKMKNCYALARQNRLFYVDGHFHENRKLGPFGLRVGGQGMIDTGTFGFPLFQVLDEPQTENKMIKRLLVSYVALARYPDDPLLDIRFLQLQACSKIHGIFGCISRLSFVDTWLNVTSILPS